MIYETSLYICLDVLFVYITGKKKTVWLTFPRYHGYISKVLD